MGTQVGSPRPALHYQPGPLEVSAAPRSLLANGKRVLNSVPSAGAGVLVRCSPRSGAGESKEWPRPLGQRTRD